MNWVDEWLFPRRCPVCLDIVVPRGAWICDACRGKLAQISQPRCFQCGRQLSHTEEEFCKTCRRFHRSFVRGIAGWDYGSVPVRRMISEVKYHNHRQLLDWPCRRMAEEYRELVRSWGVECLVPVPIYRARRRRRGFNQAEEIAGRLGEVWELPVETRLLFRVKKTTPQKELDASARVSNLVDAFAVRQTGTAYTAVALVDDILTTGSTMEACTRVLHEAGVERVYSVALTAGSSAG